jgi:hypothetical protein
MPHAPNRGVTHRNGPLVTCRLGGSLVVTTDLTNVCRGIKLRRARLAHARVVSLLAHGVRVCRDLPHFSLGGSLVVTTDLTNVCRGIKLRRTRLAYARVVALLAHGVRVRRDFPHFSLQVAQL